MQTTFLSMDDMIRYLDCTFCIYKGEPVYVRVSMDSLTKVTVYPINSRPTGITVNVDDEAFQTYPFELGFTNTDEGAVFLSRSGVRHSNYGLKTGFINIDRLNTRCNWSCASLSKYKEFRFCLNNKYPSLPEAISSVKEDSVSVAFNKYYCIGCVEEYDNSVLGIYFMSDSNPFAILNEETGKFSVAMKTNKNLSYFSAACKSSIIPLKYQ